MLTVSIVVSTFNRPQLLHQALSKAAEQSYEDFEVLIVDDGGDENTREKLEEYRADSDARLRWFNLPSRSVRLSNPAVSRNYVMQQARGELIAFCDDDDYWCDPCHLESAVTAFETHPELDLFFADQVGMHQGETRIQRWQPELPTHLGRSLEGVEDLHEISRRTFSAPWLPHLNTSVIRRKLLQRAGEFWVYTPMEEDVEFLVRCAAAARLIAFRDRVVAVHEIPDRENQVNASTRISRVEHYSFRVAIAHHLRITTQDRAALTFARRIEQDATQKLAEAAREASPASELFLCWKGFMLRPSPGSLKSLSAALWRRLQRAGVVT